MEEVQTVPSTCFLTIEAAFRTAVPAQEGC